MTNEAKDRAIRWLTEEVRSLRLAPTVNGCEPDNWAEQLEVMETCLEAFSAITDLLTRAEAAEAENAALRKMQPVRLDDTGAQALALAAEVSELKRALAMMWFAYVNCDKETPHDYETQALEEAERLLGPWSECMPNYLRRGQKEE